MVKINGEFEYLKIAIYHDYNYWSKREDVEMSVSKVYYNRSKERIKISLPRSIANVEEIISTLIKKYDGERILIDEVNHDLEASIEISDKKYEALEWVQSLVLMYEMAKGE